VGRKITSVKKYYLLLLCASTLALFSAVGAGPDEGSKVARSRSIGNFCAVQARRVGIYTKYLLAEMQVTRELTERAIEDNVIKETRHDDGGFTLQTTDPNDVSELSVHFGPETEIPSENNLVGRTQPWKIVFLVPPELGDAPVQQPEIGIETIPIITDPVDPPLVDPPDTNIDHDPPSAETAPQSAVQVELVRKNAELDKMGKCKAEGTRLFWTSQIMNGVMASAGQVIADKGDLKKSLMSPLIPHSGAWNFLTMFGVVRIRCFGNKTIAQKAANFAYMTLWAMASSAVGQYSLSMIKNRSFRGEISPNQLAFDTFWISAVLGLRLLIIKGYDGHSLGPRTLNAMRDARAKAGALREMTRMLTLRGNPVAQRLANIQEARKLVHVADFARAAGYRTRTLDVINAFDQGVVGGMGWQVLANYLGVDKEEKVWPYHKIKIWPDQWLQWARDLLPSSN
jgi:hypothetical protein